MASRRHGRLAVFGTALLCAGLPIAGCICQQGQVSQRTSGAAPAVAAKPPPRELAWFDFDGKPEPSLLDLWPAAASAPDRKKRQLLTRRDGADLLAQNNGPDPFFTWAFETPLEAAALSVDVDAAGAGKLQLFWTDAACAVFEERCSTVEQVVAGRQTLEFVLDAARPLHGLRLDPPEVPGMKLRFHHIRLLANPRFVAAVGPHQLDTTAVLEPDGLRLSCTSPDPWVVFGTPWLDARRVKSVEVELTGAPALAPQLFWTGTACANFEQACQVRLLPVAGKDHLFSATLAGVPGWRGDVRDVRFDPDDAPGKYLLESLVFVRSDAKP